MDWGSRIGDHGLGIKDQIFNVKFQIDMVMLTTATEAFLNKSRTIPIFGVAREHRFIEHV